MTYPISVLSVLHQYGPFQVSNNRVTPEGRRSLAALHTTIHPPPGTTIESGADIRPGPPVRIFLLGARSESTLPAELWLQIAHLFPTTQFNIYFIGPEVGVPLMDGAKRDSVKLEQEGSQYGVPSATVMVTPQLKLVSVQSTYEEVHAQFGPFDPYQDIFFAFSPGLGFPDQSLIASRQPGDAPLVQAQTSWHKALLQILETKCGLFFTAFSPTDLARDVSALYGTQPPTAAPNAPSEYPSTVTLPTEPVPPIEGVTDEFDLILTPGQNPFGSRKWEIAEWDPRVAVKTNWGMWGIRGKRYEVITEKDEDKEE
jgi:splicing suppressor protein 51